RGGTRRRGTAGAGRASRVVLIALIGVGMLTSLEAQSRRRPPARYLGGHTPDQAEGARILEDMRSIGLAGPYYQEFDLRILPRKEGEPRLEGGWFGARNERGPITRLELLTAAAAGGSEVLLVQNGPEPVVWRLGREDGPQQLEGAGLSEPLAGTTLSAAD